MLQNAGIPTTRSGIPSSVLTDNVSFIGRVDHAPFDWNTFQPAKTTYSLTAYAKYSHVQGLSLSPVGTPAHEGETEQAIGSLQGEYSFYFGQDYLGDVRSSLSYNHNAVDPYQRIPGGQVLVNSAFPDGTGGESSLLFGGNTGLNSDTRQWTWESIGEFQFYAQGKPAHRIKLTTDARLDGYTQNVPGNQYGSYAYNSLADLGNNAPASFSRTLNAPIRTGG